ncbi:Putative 3-hydroxyphenylpropionic transporter MhpT [Paraburkholderia tropica]|uniref:MFS transporter n=1 Tax=Paraburkholderia tropica TaxID=92647 RepID=UPI001CB65850|nr:MFS transporter [Paraburkholderia tropica]CAG9201653.1 Putative 3-hydroxyphenylpropionic transporter MhpT [Paraburkholderia tropica]
MTTNAMTSASTQSIARTISVAVVFTLFVAVVFGFGLYLFALVVPVMRQRLGFDYTAIGLVTGGAQTAYLVAALVCPRLVKRYGAGQVIVGAVVAAALLLLLVAQVQNVLSVGLALAGLGATAAFMMIPTVGAISETVPFDYRSRVNGLVSSGTAYGQFANGALVARLLPEHGWRSIWIVAGSASLVIALVGLLALRVFAPQVFVREAPPRAEHRSASGGVWRLVTRPNVTVWMLLALSGMACGPWQNYLSSFLADERHHSLDIIGQVWSTIGVVGLFSGFAAGMAADKAGVRIALAFSFAALAGSGLLIAFHAEVWQLRAAAVCFGLSFYAIYGLIPAYISKTVDAMAATAVFAVANVLLGLGTTVGNVLGGHFPGWLGSLNAVFITASALACMAMLLTATLRDERTAAAQNNVKPS